MTLCLDRALSSHVASPQGLWNKANNLTSETLVLKIVSIKLLSWVNVVDLLIYLGLDNQNQLKAVRRSSFPLECDWMHAK